MLHDKGIFRDISHIAVWDVEDLLTRASRTSEEWVQKLLKMGKKKLQEEGELEEDEEEDLDADPEGELDGNVEGYEEEEEVPIEQNYAAASEVFRFLQGLTLTERAARMLLPFESGRLGDVDFGRGGCGFIFEEHDLPDGNVIVIAMDFEDALGSRDEGGVYGDYFSWFLIDPGASGTVKEQ